MRLRLTRGVALLFVIGLFMACTIPTDASAQSDSTSPCAMQTGTENAGLFAPLPRDSYAVYVQLAKHGQLAALTLYAEATSSGGCTAIGQTTATGDGWTYVGSWQMTAAPEDGAMFTLDSDELDIASDANRPTIMLVSETNPACSIAQECQVVVDGHTGTILPPSNSIATNIVRVARAVSPDTDTVVRVLYYVDEQLVYSTKQLEPFDLRYVTHGGQRAVSVIEYASGQRIRITHAIPLTHNDTFFNYIFRLYQKNATLVIVAGISLIIWIIGALIVAILHAIEHRYYWRLAHGFIRQKHADIPGHHLSEEEYFRRQRVKTIAVNIFKGLNILLLVAIVSVSFNRFIATLYRVSGSSMSTAYHDGGGVVVNRLPVTVAAISQREYIPKRGEVVILHAVYGYTQQESERDDSRENYIIKRTIGLPGERITIRDGVITVYTKDGTVLNPDEGASWAKTMVVSDAVENIDITLGEDELFVIGDNRPESLDSRFNGAIRLDEVVGSAAVSVW